LSAVLSSASRSSAKSAPATISPAIVPARLPDLMAQARTGPAIQVAVTGSAPFTVATGYCNSIELITMTTVTARSALSSSGVRRAGRA
jgi:hypothetical protein